MRLLIAVLVMLLTATTTTAQQAGKYRIHSLLFKDNFKNGLDSTTWITEIAHVPNSRVYTENGRLILDTKGGVTVWLNKLLSGNISIEYTRRVLTTGKPNDRLSDLNQFWMAKDPRNSNLFTRNGVLEEYDSLQLYYVGMGGNTNSTTRFRKYEGNGERKLLQEYKDTAHLLTKDKVYRIRIIVKDGVTSYWVNGEQYFSYADPSLLKEGYFGFRSTWSRQEISNVRIYKLY